MQIPFLKRVTYGSVIYLKTPRLRGMLFLYFGVAAAVAAIGLVAAVGIWPAYDPTPPENEQ